MKRKKVVVVVGEQSLVELLPLELQNPVQPCLCSSSLLLFELTLCPSSASDLSGSLKLHVEDLDRMSWTHCVDKRWDQFDVITFVAP